MSYKGKIKNIGLAVSILLLSIFLTGCSSLAGSYASDQELILSFNEDGTGEYDFRATDFGSGTFTYDEEMISFDDGSELNFTKSKYKNEVVIDKNPYYGYKAVVSTEPTDSISGTYKTKDDAYISFNEDGTGELTHSDGKISNFKYASERITFDNGTSVPFAKSKDEIIIISTVYTQEKE